MERAFGGESLLEQRNYKTKDEVGPGGGQWQEGQVRGHQVGWPWVQPASPLKGFLSRTPFLLSSEGRLVGVLIFHPKMTVTLQRVRKQSLLYSLRLVCMSLSLALSGSQSLSRGRAQHWGFEQA